MRPVISPRTFLTWTLTAALALAGAASVAARQDHSLAVSSAPLLPFAVAPGAGYARARRSDTELRSIGDQPPWLEPPGNGRALAPRPG